MFDLFGIKKLTMKKDELEAENNQLKAALYRTNSANTQLNTILKGKEELLHSYSDKIKDLTERLRMNNAQKQAATRYNDNERNY
jgi:hypothetical protein